MSTGHCPEKKMCRDALLVIKLDTFIWTAQLCENIKEGENIELVLAFLTFYPKQ